MKIVLWFRRDLRFKNNLSLLWSLSLMCKFHELTKRDYELLDKYVKYNKG